MPEYAIYDATAHVICSGSTQPNWLTPPVVTASTVNGKPDAVGMFCNVLNTGNRNYFSCIAAGAYTVSVYKTVGGALISSQNVASGVQCNWQIDWADCTHNIDTDTRQAYAEITPQAGQSLTLVRLDTNHPAETNTNSSTNIVNIFHSLPSISNATNMHSNNYALQSITHDSYPALTNATNMHYNNYALQSVKHGNYPALTNATGMHSNNYALQSITHDSYPALTNATNMHSNNYVLHSCYFANLNALVTVTGMFGTTTENTCCRSLRKLITNGLGTAFAAGTTFVLRYTAIQETEALAWVASLGSSSNTVTFDLRSNPFSTSTSVSPAIIAKFPNATVLMV